MARTVRGKKPCKAEACEIQSCLESRGYKVDRCLEVILRLKGCCDDNHYGPDHCASLAGLIEEATKRMEQGKRPS